VEITGTTGGRVVLHPLSPLQAFQPGVSRGTITFNACVTSPTCPIAAERMTGSGQTVAVEYRLTGIMSFADVRFDLRDAPQAADLAKSFLIFGYPEQNFTVTSTVPWVTVTQATPNLRFDPNETPTQAGYATLTAHLVESETDQMSGMGPLYRGEIVVTPAQGTEIRIPLSLGIMRTRVNFVAPYLARANTPGDVIIRGEYFSQVTPTGVMFGNVAATSYTVVSDTEVRARHPALPAGDYTVQLTNAQGFHRTRAKLVVRDDPAHVAVRLDYPTTNPVLPKGLLYDAERRAVVVGYDENINSPDRYRLLRYSAASGWNIDVNRSVGGDQAIALSPDGTEISLASQIVVPNGVGTINVLGVESLDPVTLVARTATPAPRMLAPRALSIAYANDGQAVIGSVGLFDPIERYGMLRPEMFEFPQPPPSLHVISMESANAIASGDGSRVLLSSEYSSVGGGYPIKRYDVDARTLTDTSVAMIVYSSSLNRTGSRLALDHRIYDADFNLLGTLPTSSRAVALSPVAPRAYAWDVNGTVRRFDLAAPTVNGEFPELVPAIVPLPGAGQPDIQLSRLIVTPDEGAVVIAGRRNAQILPVP
jgi:hypothetical protein